MRKGISSPVLFPLLTVYRTFQLFYIILYHIIEGWPALPALSPGRLYVQDYPGEAESPRHGAAEYFGIPPQRSTALA